VARYRGVFEVASHLGMSLDECLQKHTKRQIAAWLVYLKQKWDSPTTTEYYLMQIAAEIRRTKAKDPRRVRIEDLRIIFRSKRSHRDMTEEEKKQAAQASKNAWIGMFKGKVKVVNSKPD